MNGMKPGILICIPKKVLECVKVVSIIILHYFLTKIIYFSLVEVGVMTKN
jgi:hypothetical protein